MEEGNFYLWAEVISQSEENYDYFFRHLVNDLRLRHRNFHVFDYIVAYKGMQGTLEWALYRIHRTTNAETTLPDYYFIDAAVESAIRMPPDGRPTNLKPYIESGCRNLREVIDMLVKDYEESHYIDFPTAE